VKTTLAFTLCFLTCSAACGVDSVGTGGGGNGADAGGGGGGGADAAPVSNRVTDGLALLYRFNQAPGATVVPDTSNVGTSYDLTVADPAAVTFDGTGMVVTAPTVVQNMNPVTKVIDACQASNEMTVEAWVMNASVDGVDARIVSSATDAANRNFLLKQGNDNFYARIRTTDNGNGQQPEPTALGVATIGSAEHVIFTRSFPEGVVNFYINGTKLAPTVSSGSFGNWLLDRGLYVANEPSLDRPWLGEIYLLAVYCKELSASEVVQNYNDGY
jgi:Concanavalin A-like lectin/glucanases superfamily